MLYGNTCQRALLPELTNEILRPNISNEVHVKDDAVNSPKNPIWHNLEIGEAAELLQVDLNKGLSQAEAKERLERFGPNTLPDSPPTSLLTLFLKQFMSPLIYLLFAAAGIAFILGEISDGFVILIVVILNSLIGSFQEGRAERSLKSLKQLSKHHAKVLRDGAEEIIESRFLVPGDILILNAGDSIGADSRLVSNYEVKVAEAALTGESVPVEKKAAPLAQDTHLPDRINMLFSGTLVAAGKAHALAVATGQKTQIGKIAQLAAQGKEPKTPLELKVETFGKLIMALSAFVFLLIIAIGLLKKIDPDQILMIAISQIVALIPEGLPVAITVTLAVGVRRMAERKSVIRKLSAVETLGSTNIVCTDKTGTLTRNEMTVQEVYLPSNALLHVSGSGYSPKGNLSQQDGNPFSNEELDELLRCAALCNDSSLVHDKSDAKEWLPIGDPTEVALLTVAQKRNLTKDSLEKEFPRTNELPFDSATQIMMTQHLNANQKVIYLKGAPEKVFALCADIGGAEQISKTMANQALRVLAFAKLTDVDLNIHDDLTKLQGRFQFLGLMGQMDPPREEVFEAVKECQNAQIRPIMITGDHKQTAHAIGKMLQIVRDKDEALDGAELDKMSDEELNRKLHQIAVFARVHPEQKMRIINAFRQQNNVVAMTGDGVNDAPALSRADVGIAMGITGTDAAKEAAKMIVTDDNFATIVQAIRQGRLVYRNVKKLLLYLFSVSIAEVVILIGAMLLGYPPPLAAVQILWINLVTDGVLTLTLIMEPEEGDEMKHRPIPKNDPLITRAMRTRMAYMIPAIVVSTLGYFIYAISLERPMAEVQTATFTVLAISQWLNALNCRSDWQSSFRMSLWRNKSLIGGLVVGSILQSLVIYAPFMNKVFHTQAIPLGETILLACIASLVFWVEEVRKIFVRRRRKIHGKV